MVTDKNEIAQLLIKFTTDFGDLKKSIPELQAEVKKIEGGIFSGLASFKAAWLGVVAGAAGAVLSLKSFIDEAAEAEQIETRLRYALETLGYSWKEAKANVDEFAESIQKTTRFSDEQARQALTDMLLYTRDFAKAQTGAKLAMDVSVRTGHDLSSSTRLIGMAMSGNVEILGRYIPELKNLDEKLGADATAAQKAEYALKILNDKFSGTAQNDIKTYAGQVALLKNEWSDFKETVGGFLIGPATAFIKWLREAATESKAMAGDLRLALGGGTEEERLKKMIEDKRRLAEKYTRIYEGELPSSSDINTGAVSEFNLPILNATERAKALAEATRLMAEIAELEKKLTPATVTPSKPDDLRSAYEKKYGMTEAELQDRLATSKLLHEAWKFSQGMDPESLANAEYVLKHQLEGEKQLSDDILEAWTFVDEGKIAQDLEWQENKKRADQLILEGELDHAEKIKEAWASVYEVIKENNLKSYEEMKKIQEFFDRTIGEMGEGALMDFFGSMNNGFKDLGDTVRSIGMHILEMIEQMIAKAIIFGNIMGTKNAAGGYGGLVGLIGSLFSSGGNAGVGGGLTGWLAAAEGGKITGGSGVRDDVPIRAMGGEYIQPKDAVRFYGEDIMEKIRRREIPASVFAQFRSGLQAARPGMFFATGGMVSGQVGAGGKIKLEMEIVTEPGFHARFKSTPEEVDLMVATKYKTGGHIQRAIKER